MILDNLKNIDFYNGINARLAAGLNFLAKTDLKTLSPGRHEIDGDNLFALIQDYTTKPQQQGLWEAHRRYVDIQYIVTGTETIGYAATDSLTVTQPYAQDKDCELFSGTGDFFRLNAGDFAVFAPPDAHMPSLTDSTPSQVRKAVVKVLI